MPLSHPKSAFHLSGNHQTMSHLAAPGNVCVPRSHGALAAWFSGVTSHFRRDCWGSWPFCAISHTEITGTKGTTFCQPVTLSTPFSAIGWVGSGTSQKPLSGSFLGYSLRKWKILTLQKAWPIYKLGNPPPKKMASEWHSSFCQKQREDSKFPYLQSFKALSQDPDLRDSCCMCLSVASLSLVPLCLSPSDFQTIPTQPFSSTWSLGKDSEVSFHPGLSPIFKNLRDQIHPFQSILVHWFLHVGVHSCHLLFDHFQFTLIHGPNIPDSYVILVFTASDSTSITSPIHNRALFSLWIHLFILSGVISLLFPSSILGTYRPEEVIFQYHIFLSFHAIHGVLKERILKWFAIPFFTGPRFVRTLHHDSPILGGHTRHGS